MDKLEICDTSEMPKGEGLETPLHPLHPKKRMRIGQPSQTAHKPEPTASVMLPSLLMYEYVESGQSGSGTPSGSPMKVRPEDQSPSPSIPPSPAKYVESGQSVSGTPLGSPMKVRPEDQSPSPSIPPLPAKLKCGQSDPSTPSCSPMVRPPLRVRKNLKMEDTFHFGSDGSSDESDDEAASSFIPRVFRSTQDTPVDEDESVTTLVNTPAIDNQSDEVDASSAEPHQPSSFYSFDWKAFPDPPIPPESRRETFSESSGPTIPHGEPYDIFIAIWDRQCMEFIAVETNRYAQQVTQRMMDNNSLRPNSRILGWHDTTADELYVYFGIIIAMGVVIKSRLDEYWSTTADIFITPGFGAHMPINRFLLLNKFLHFNNNEDMCASELTASDAKLFKIKPLLVHLNYKFQSIYKLAQNIALDESLLQWKGWLDINQLVPNKTAVVGIKSHEICESQTGYLWRFEIHAHKKSPQQRPEEPLNAFTPSIVLRLIHGLQNKGHALWMDNFYNSPSLARCLKAWGIDCVGTLRTNRQFVPPGLNNLTKGNMRKGQITGQTSGDVDVMVWRDNNRVGMISTYHGNAVKQVRGSTKPILILDYNIMMGGVDKKDQMLAMYPMERKRTKVWYKKLFRRLLNVSILNSYIIHHHSSPLSHRNFRISLVKSLLSKHCSTAPLIPLPSAVTRQNQPVDLTHRLAEYPIENSYRKRRVCKVCKKRVHTYCVGCSKSVCLDPCFYTLHKSLNK